MLLVTTLVTICLDADSAASIHWVTQKTQTAPPSDRVYAWEHGVASVVDFLADQDTAWLKEVSARQWGSLGQYLTEVELFVLGRNDGKRGGKSASMVHRSDRFQPIDQATYRLSEQPAKIGKRDWDAAFPRTFTLTKLRERESGKRLWVGDTNVHDHGFQGPQGSGELIVREVLEVGGDLVLMMDGFKGVQDSNPNPALVGQRFLHAARLISRAKVIGPERIWNRFSVIVPSRGIDHFFIRGPVMVHRWRMFGPKAQRGRSVSDHLPAKARICLASSSLTAD